MTGEQHLATSTTCSTPESGHDVKPHRKVDALVLLPTGVQIYYQLYRIRRAAFLG